MSVRDRKPKKGNMTNVIVTYVRRPKRCELCGKAAETRPYGPGGKDVCFSCGMKNENEAKRQFAKTLGKASLR